MNQTFLTFYLALALAGVLVSTGAMAGHPRDERGAHHGPPHAEHQLMRLDRALDLSDEQSAELLTILQAAEAEREALHRRVMAEMKPEICAHMESTHEAILSVLTADQAEEFEEMVARRNTRFSGRRGDMPDINCDDN